ncbi:MAG: FHA domain-containing protein [Victivallales bacterium]|jgi:MoxR-like ATPase|nr:FHA domain-containing protein [Victivallales bacterium]MBT7166358.1 FHA domain-containing protein [Victivallales bacterium]MBT7303746.1 FHA domain-containing protein [Victivallales bacterium]
MAKLEILEGPDAGRKYEVEGGRLIIGRGDECDIRLNQGSISRQHAVLDYINGSWYVEDLGSQNGVFIEGEKVDRAEVPASINIQFGTIMTAFDPDFGGDTMSLTMDSVDGEDEFAEEAEESIGAEAISAIRDMGRVYGMIEEEFGQVIIGQRAVLEELLVAIAAGGHVLMIGLPGLAKTLMVSTLAEVLRLKFKRIQFTPDLMPSDIIGTDVLEIDEQTSQKTFRFIRGPIFTNLLLADEINRTPPKTQAALLEAMQERQVTVANHVFPLPPPFFVLATQNPLEQEGTYPLPEAQLDRFMFNIIVDYPNADEEERIVAATTKKQSIELKQVLAASDLIALQNTVRELPVSEHVIKYATRLVRMTRPTCEESPQFIKDYVHCGAGPRAAQFLVLGGKARAVLHGNLNVSCDDIKALARPVLRHRLFTNFTADSEGIGPDDLIEQLLEAAPEPDQSEY